MPRSSIILLTCLAASLWGGRLRAQGPNLSLASAIKARRALERGVDAVGGLAALHALRDVTRELAGVRTDPGQGPHPLTMPPTYAGLGTVPPAVNHPRVLSVRDYKNQRASDHLRDVIYGGQRLEWRVVATREAAFRAYYDYIDHAVRSTPAASLVGARANAMRRYPESLLLSAWNRLNTARWIAEESWDGRPHDVVLFADADGALVTLYLDRGTGRLSKVEFIGDDAILGDIAIETAYDDYRETGPLTLPWRYVDRTGGYVLQDLRATSIRLDTQPADSFFTLPEEFPEVAPPPSTPQVEKLGEQVYAILGNDYNSLAVGFNDYIMVLEAGGNSSWSQAVIARVKEVIPNKPIRYLVTTHWNFDHLAGVRSYIAEGTTILATPMTKAVIERAAAATHALRPDALSRNPKPPVIELMDGSKRVFSDGTRTVEIHDISPSPHVDEMLIAYLPVEKTLFEGDLFDLAVAGRVGTGGEDTADLERKIRDLRLDVRRIVPVHGVVGTMDDLRQALARRAAAR